MKHSALREAFNTRRKSHKEEKLLGNNFFGNSFIYGKKNYFYPVTLGFGQQVMYGQDIGMSWVHGNPLSADP